MKINTIAERLGELARGAENSTVSDLATLLGTKPGETGHTTQETNHMPDEETPQPSIQTEPENTQGPVMEGEAPRELDLEPRNLVNVIDAMLIIIPEEEVDFRNTLLQDRSENMYSPPEDQDWHGVANRTLRTHCEGREGEPWIENILALWRGEAIITPAQAQTSMDTYKGRFFIVNRTDRPCERLVAELGGDGMLHYIHPDTVGRSDRQPLVPDEAIPLEDFGISVHFEMGMLFGEKSSESTATYHNGEARPWQGTSSFFFKYTKPTT